MGSPYARASPRRVPVARPDGYNASTFEIFRRAFALQPPSSLNEAYPCLGPIPTDAADCPADSNQTRRWCKCDMISGGAPARTNSRITCRPRCRGSLIWL